MYELYFWTAGYSLFSNFMKLLASIRLKSSEIPSVWKSNLAGYADYVNEKLSIPDEIKITPDEIKPDSCAKQHAKVISKKNLYKNHRSEAL